MKAYKRILITVVILSIALTGFPVTGALAAADSGDVYTIKVTTNNAPYLTIGNQQYLDFIYAGALAFKNYCEANSNGRIEVEIYHSGQLGNTVESLQQCTQGVIQAAFAGDGEMATLYPNIQTLSVPYLFDNRVEFYALLDSEFMAEMFAEIESQLGIMTLATSDNGGFRNFSNSRRKVRTAEDLRGMKIRCMEIPAHTIMLESMGAIATPMAYSELYTSLQTGVVDGQENSPGTTLNGSFHEVNQYYTLDGHSISSLQLYFNSDFYNSLPADLQEVVIGAGKMAQDANRGFNNANEALALEELENAGMQIYYPTDAEKDTFRVSQEPVLEWLRGQIGDDYVEAFMTAVDAAKAGTIAEAAGASATGGSGTGSSVNGITIGAIVVAVAAVIFAVFMAMSNRRRDDDEEEEDAVEAEV